VSKPAFYKIVLCLVLIVASGMVYISNATPEPRPVGYHLYVANRGSDLNPGSQSEPFRTIQRAASLATPGTTVHVAPGTYRENVTTKVHGTAAARIRYVSDARWGAKIIGSGTEFMWTNRCDYTDIIGFDISGTGREGILNLASHTLIPGNHVHHLAVSGGCTGGGGAGINNADYKGSDGDIIGNVVHDIGVPGKCIGVHGIYVANLRGKVYDNVVYRASAWGIHLWHAADKVLVSNNTVFQNGSASMGGGIVMGVGDSPGGKVMTNTKVINNIVYDNPYRGIMQFCYDGQNCIGGGNVVANNLVSGSATDIIMKVGDATGTITADPQFVKYQPDGTGDYRLKSTSPAFNKGAPSAAAATDPDSRARENF
jgi:hypothetical protein